MNSNQDLENFIGDFDGLVHSVGGPDLDYLCKKYGELDNIPDGLVSANTMMSALVSVGVSLARLGYSNSDLMKDLEHLRGLFEQSSTDGYNGAFELIRQRYQETKITKEKRQRLTKKLDEMNQVIDRCNSTPSRRRCLCIELECLTPFCGRRVAGHGYLVCDRHHDAYCDSEFRGGLLDWASRR